MNQNVIDVLTTLQNASNQISAPNPGDFHWPIEKIEDIPAECVEAIAELMGRNSAPPGPDALPGNEFIFAYNVAMAPDQDPYRKQAYGETALKVFNNYANANKENANKMLEVLTKHFEHPVPIPDPSGPVTPDQLLDCAKQLQEYIQQLESEGSQLDDPGSLASSLRNVVADIEKAFEGVDANSPQDVKDAAMSEWIMDQQDQGSAGKQTIQDNLQKAIAATQSLDDVQKEDLRQAQYIFDQVIKCAAAMMQTCTKIIEKMGQGIGRG
jgi:hypothetical protein